MIVQCALLKCYTIRMHRLRDSSVNIPLPPDQHHCSEEVKWRITGWNRQTFQCICCYITCYHVISISESERERERNIAVLYRQPTKFCFYSVNYFYCFPVAGNRLIINLWAVCPLRPGTDDAVTRTRYQAVVDLAWFCPAITHLLSHFTQNVSVQHSHTPAHV